MRWLIVAAALASASPLAAQTAPTEQVQNTVVIAAITDMRAGRHDAAIGRLDPLLAAYEKAYAGDKRLIYCASGLTETLAYMLMGAAAKREAVAITPGWCDTLFTKGFVLSDAKRFAEAQATMERAIAMRPNSAHYLNELGYILQQQRQWQPSLDAYTRARDAALIGEKHRETPEKTRALRGMGFAQIELGQWDAAESLFRECLKLDPSDGIAKNELQYIADKRPKA